jgi:23S rRNA (uracil1939-C5)-methyltransferase
LEEELFGTKLRYGLFSFFQVNVPIFKDALEDIGNFVDDTDLVDYYSGVGSIGLALHDKCQKLTLVESNPEAVEYATENIKINKLKNCEAICKPAELIIDLITSDKTLIFDPPRAGLDKRIVEKVLAELPKKIIYLSCDLSTHARDIGLLKEKYNIKFLKLYNFFPRTAHIEGLCVLEKK